MVDRRAPRRKKRIACALYVEQRRYSGIVLDISATGLFVQTSGKVLPGTLVRLELFDPDRPEPLILQASVARQRVVPVRLKTIAHGGIGVKIEQAPEEFFALVAKLQPADAQTAPPKQEKPAPESPVQRSTLARKARASRPQQSHAAGAVAAADMSFRLRVTQVGGSRSRFLDLTAPSEEEARRRVHEELGDGWKILSCECRGES
jgi:Tfp pilus assembly protein PilZ